MLRIASDVYEAMIAHARQDAPIEACGYLAEKDGLVDLVLRLTNADASPEHYSLIPTEQFAAVREMRRTGHRLRAVYHSHPTSPARMSHEDLRLAVDPNLVYLIVSLAAPKPEVKAFIVQDGAAVAVEIVVAQVPVPEQ